MQNGFARTFVHAKLCVHKTVTMGASLHRLIYDVLTDIVFPVFCHHLTLKKILVKHMLTTKDLGALTEHQLVG